MKLCYGHPLELRNFCIPVRACGRQPLWGRSALLDLACKNSDVVTFGTIERGIDAEKRQVMDCNSCFFQSLPVRRRSKRFARFRSSSGQEPPVPVLMPDEEHPIAVGDEHPNAQNDRTPNPPVDPDEPVG